MTGFLIGILLIFSALPAGFRILSFFPLPFTSDEKNLFGFAFSLFLLSTLILWLGLAGLLAPPWILAGVGTLALAGFGSYRSSIAGVLGRISRLLGFLVGLPKICFLLSAGTLFAVAVGVMAPETANDSLCYHLHVPKLFLKFKTILRVPYEINSLFPFFMEMLDVYGIAFGKDSIAKVFHAATGIGGGYAVYALARKAAGPISALLAALFFITTPGIANQMGTTYVDVSLAFFTGLSFFAYVRFFETNRLAWIFLAGLMTGIALEVKFLALVGCVSLGAILAADAVFLRRPHRFKAILLFVLGVFVFSAYWYLRSWLELGNPVYPYFHQIFKTGYPIVYTGVGPTKTVLGFLTLPWQMTMNPEFFEGFGDNIGPSYLLFAPVGLLAVHKNPIVKRVAVMALIYYALWFFLGQSLRFFFPALPALAMLAAAGIERALGAQSRFLRASWGVLITGIFVLHAGMAAYHYLPMLKVSLGLEREADYLRRTERSYRMAEYVNQNLPLDSQILNFLEVRMYYFDREIVREDIYADMTGYDRKVLSLSEALALVKRDGFTHLLLCQTPHARFQELPPNRLPRLYLDAEKTLAHSKPPLYTYTFTDGENPPVEYTLYQL